VNGQLGRGVVDRPEGHDMRHLVGDRRGKPKIDRGDSVAVLVRDPWTNSIRVIGSIDRYVQVL
jgi:hypothetical protein